MVVKLRRRRAWVLMCDVGDEVVYLRSLIFAEDDCDVTDDLDCALVYSDRALAASTLRHHLFSYGWRVVPVFVTPEDDK